MKSKKKIYSLFYRIINLLFVMMMLGILIINFFIGGKREYFTKKTFLSSNIKLFIIGFIILTFLTILYNKFIKKYIEKLKKKQMNFLLAFYFIIVFIMQIFIIKKILFLTGWDVLVLRESSELLVNGAKLNNGNGYGTYFMTYPNNLFLLFLYVILKKVALFLSINPNFLLAIVSAFSVNVSCLLITKIVYKITNNRNLSIVCIFFCTIFLLFSPWIIIPYSDTFAMLITTGILFVYLNKNDINNYVSVFLIVFLAFIGYKIKPTVIIVLISIVIIKLWKMVFSKKKINLKVILKRAFPVGIAIIFIFALNTFSVNYLGYERNTNIEMPMTHFLMMGINKERSGVYLDEDVLYTQSYKGLDEKKDANIKEIKRRLKKYGIDGYVQLLVNKSLVNYNDGTFAWGVEGNFYSQICAEDGKLATLLKNIYYSDGSGEYYAYYSTMMQGVWILLLVLSLFSFPYAKRYKITVLQLTIIGITLFLLLFEARARYLLLYAPYFIIVSILGYSFVRSKINNIIRYCNNVEF